ncbi:DMT family transporter [Brevibacillus parabrevis]|jgi:Permeases of the drug/metabolite transporter (DMT) superfamily|uniref:DMT family transporter n=1 Tax=Brevibacillus parabrevis TaxID=54914 RepID=UPI00249019C5|nr:DMT family transporter [Brevibacillus parabrevis]
MNAKLFFMLLSFSIFTGATFNLAKYTVDYFSPFAAAAWRFGLAAMVMVAAILLIKERGKTGFLKHHAMMYTILGVIGIFGFNALFFLGMKFTSPVNGALIMATNPLITTIFSKYILGTPISKQQAWGISFSLLGVIFVLTQGSWSVISNLSFSVGDMLILLGNVCWALYGVLGRRYLRNSSSLQTTTSTMVAGACFLVMLSSVTPHPQPVSGVPVEAWGAIAFMAFFTTVLGYLFWNEGVKAIGASKTSIFFNVVPVVTMILSWLSGMSVTWIQIGGAVLVFVGVVFASGISFRGKRQYVAAK